MVRYIVIAGVVLFLSMSLVDAIQRSDVMQPKAAAARRQEPPPAPPRARPAQTRTVVIQARNGAFAARANVDGRPMEFIVDTGATVVSIRESDAASLGIHPIASDYKIPIATANGKGVAAAAELAKVEIDGIEVLDIPALVVPDSALSANLLGMSFLSRVRWTHETGRLVLEQ